MNLLIGFFTIVLILVCLFMVLIILMQRPRSDSGLGAALGGGGAAESAFGAETGNILSKSTLYCAVFFFVATFVLYLGHMYTSHRGVTEGRDLPEMRAVGDIDPVDEDAAADPDEELVEPEETPIEEEGVPPSPLD